MDNLFDSIDLNDLANSEEAIIDSNNLKTALPKISEPKKEEPENKKGSIKIEEDPDAIDINDLIGSDEDNDNEENIEEVDQNSDLKSTKKTKSPAGSNATSSSQESSTLPSLALVLQEAGLFSSLEEEDIKNIKSVEDLTEAVAKQIKANELADLSEEDKEYLDARRKGISHTEFLQKKSVAEQYSKISDELVESNESLQHELIKRSFMIKGFDETKAKKHADAIMQGEDAVDDAKDAKKALVAHEETSLKEKIKKQEDEYQKSLEAEKTALETLKSKVHENFEILPGIKVNSQTKDKIFSSMTTPVSNKNNQFKNDVMEAYGNNMEYKMKLHALHIITKGLTDFSKFKTSAKSQAVLDLEKKMEQTTKTSIGTTKSSGFSGGSTTKEMINSLPDFGSGR